jgi:hypothetical protein
VTLSRAQHSALLAIAAVNDSGREAELLTARSVASCPPSRACYLPDATAIALVRSKFIKVRVVRIYRHPWHECFAQITETGRAALQTVRNRIPETSHP